MSLHGTPDKPDGFTCSTCQRVARVVVWQGVKIGSRNVTWMLCPECFGLKRQQEERK